MRHDLISIVESAYDLRASRTQWLQGLADSFWEVLRPEVAMTAHHVEIRGGALHLVDAAQSHAIRDIVTELRRLFAAMEAMRNGSGTVKERLEGRRYERILRTAFHEPADRLTHSEYRRGGPEWMYTFRLAGDTLVLRNMHMDIDGVTLLVGGLRERRSFSPAERQMYQRLNAHVAAGFRLRNRLGAGSSSVDVSDGGAVLDPSGKVLHAEGDARDSDALDELSAVARRIDAARSERSGRGEESLAVWRGLVRGQWSLVDTVDVDGKHLMLVHRNPEDVCDPRGLTEMESRVAGLAVRGYTDALIAYHLGLSDGTVSAHLSRAMQKLRISGRVELVRRLGTRYPKEAL
jgi:DNA-binding CsgD family transcriptional regulator